MINPFFQSLFENKSLIIISDGDLDGLGATIVSIYYLKPVCKDIEHYNTFDREFKDLNWNLIEKSDIVIFTDISSPSLDFYKKLTKEYKKEVLIFDHHASHREILGENIENYFYDESKSATKIFFEQLTKGSRVNRVIREFVELVNCYDCWHDEDILWQEAIKLNFLKAGYIEWNTGRNKPDFEKNLNFINAMLFKFEKLKSFTYNFKEIRLISSEKFKENKYYNEAKKSMKIRIDNNGNKYAYIESVSKLSIIANKILKEYNDIDYIVARSTFKNAVDNLSLSLRSNGNCDVKRIAEKWRGGGHINASGIAMQDKKDYLNVISGRLHLL